MPEAKFILTGDVAKFLSEALKVGNAQKRMETGFKRTTAEGTRGMRELERETQRLARASETAAVRRVAAIRASTGSGAPAMTPMMRAAALTGGGSQFVLDSVAIQTQRLQMAQKLRDERAFAGFVASQQAHNIVQGGKNLAGMDLLLARGQRISSTAAGRTDQRNELEAELAELRLRARDKAKADRLAMRNRLATGALAVGAAVTAIAAGAEEELNRYADTLMQFEETMAPLYGVGSNMRSRPRLRQQVLATSGGTGIAAPQVAELMGQLQSTFGDLPPAVAQEIVAQTTMSRKLGVRNLPTFAVGLGGMYQAFGQSMGGGPGAARTLANMFERSADVGGFQKDQITPYLARVMTNFRAAGYSPAEAFSALSVVSRSGLEPEVYATGLANVALDFVRGNATGQFKTTGDFGRDMSALARMPAPEQLKLLGERGFPIAGILTNQLPLYQKLLGPIAGSNAREDVVGGKVSAAWTDQLYGPTTIMQSARQTQTNAALINADVRPDLLNAVTDWEVRKAGADLTTHPMLSWFKSPSVWMETALNAGETNPKYMRTDLLAAGAASIASQSRQAGDEVKASYVELAYGLTGSGATGRPEAEEYRRMIGQGHVGLTGGEFMEWKRLSRAGGNAAADYLKKVGGFQQPNEGATGGGDPLMNLAMAAQAAANYLNNTNRGRSVPTLPIGVAAPGGLQ